MSEAEKKPCEECGGTGAIFVDDLNVRECKCAYAKRLKAHLGPEIAGAPLPDLDDTESLLFLPGGEDCTEKNTILQGYWTDVLPQIKWALGCKGPMFRFTVLTDEKLRTVYLGKESYAQRAKSKRDDMETFNSLADIVGTEYDLVIIKLGFLGYKNIAMPGILKESLMLREVACKPTWLVESPQAPFASGHFAHNDDVAEYIRTRFDSVKFSAFDPARVEGVAPQAYKKVRAKQASEPAKPPPEPMDVDDAALSPDISVVKEEDEEEGQVELPRSEFDSIDVDIPGTGPGAKKKWKPSKSRRGDS